MTSVQCRATFEAVMAVRGAWEQLGEWDARAAALARGAGALRLLLGEALAQVDSRGAHHALGFSSLGAYVAERCQRGGTWAREATRLARALTSFTALRAATLRGLVTWSALGWALRGLQPYVSARSALAEGVLEAAEKLWLERAQTCTVRALAAMVRRAEEGAAGVSSAVSRDVPGLEPKDNARLAPKDAAGFAPKSDAQSGSWGASNLHPFLVRLPDHTLTITVRTETAWWLACARGVYERSVSDCPWTTRGTEHFVLALLAEARTALEGEAPLDEGAVERWGTYVRLLDEWRDEAERRCDAHRPVLPTIDGIETTETAGEDLGGATVVELDERVRLLSLALGRRDVELGVLADLLSRAEAWRRLGFASEAHYVRERMGCSYSQWKARRALARRLTERAAVQAAFLQGEIGLEAALLVLRVVRDEASERSWVERARERTCKHLREEVRAAELGEQQFGLPPAPPSEDTVRRVLALEGRVKSGNLLHESDANDGAAVDASAGGAGAGSAGADGAGEDGAGAVGVGANDRNDRRADDRVSRMSVAGRAWLRLRGELSQVFLGAFPGGLGEPDVRREPKTCPPAQRRKGEVRLRLRLERDTLVEFRALERLFRRQHRGDFLEFCCRHFLEVWAPTLLADVKYAHVYRRDAFTCSSPVCSRHDVHPHHLKFRSQGGGDDLENLTSLCTWCHLEGVHGGRIRVEPPASAMHWRIGAARSFEVRGRRKIEVGRRQPAATPRAPVTCRDDVGGAMPSARR